MWRILAVAALAGARADEGLKAKDLEGVWTGARFTEGKGDNPKIGVKLEITFKGDTVSVRKESGTLVGEATFALSADGKTIDATGTTSGYRGKTYLGIIKVEGDTLYWCTTGTASRTSKRPTGYVASPGPAHYLIVATKQAKKK